MDLEVKKLMLKALSDSGEGAALFALWSTPDHDGDMTERGFFGDGRQEVFMVAHHIANSGAPPLAKGTIFETSQGAEYRFKMNTELESARGWLPHFKFDLREGREPRQVWSYGFRILPGGATPRRDGRGRMLHAIKETGEPGAVVLEVSPVLAASQPLSRTLAAKTDGAPLTRAQAADAARIKRWLDEMLAARTREEQLQAKQLHLAYLHRQIALMKGGLGYEL